MSEDQFLTYKNTKRNELTHIEPIFIRQRKKIYSRGAENVHELNWFFHELMYYCVFRSYSMVLKTLSTHMTLPYYK